MKISGLIVSMLLLVSSLSAFDDWDKRYQEKIANIGKAPVDNSWFMELSTGVTTNEGVKLGGVEPLDNIVGGSSMRSEIAIGLTTIDDSKITYQGAAYVWKNNQDKFGENGIGVQGRLKSPAYLNGLVKFGLLAGAGYGWQPNEGDMTSISSNLTSINFVTDSYQLGNYTAKFVEDTHVLEIELGIGVDVKLTESFSLFANTSYIRKYYDFSYDIYQAGTLETNIDGSNMNHTKSGVCQDNYSFDIGIAYKF